MPMKTGVVKSSSVEGYLKTENVMLWHHIENFKSNSYDEAVDKIRRGKLDILIADTAIVEYYRANDPDCSLRILGQPVFDDTYAVGMPKEFPLKEALSDLFLEYDNYGFVDQLKKKWFKEAECAKRYHRATPLSFLSVSGVYIFLITGFFLALLAQCIEKMWFDSLQSQKKQESCYWKCKGSMFWSQKAYRYINGIQGSSYYSMGDADSTDSESRELTKAMRTDLKEPERRSSF
jgi:ionotropic glutamate receptor NMDA 3A